VQRNRVGRDASDENPTRGCGECQARPEARHLPDRATRSPLPDRRMDRDGDDHQYLRHRCLRREQLVGPWDFRRICDGGRCKTFLYSASYYGVNVAEVVPTGRGRYVATFRPAPVPCPHRPGEDAGTNRDHSMISLRWSPDKQTLYGLGRDYQVGPCGNGKDAPELSSYVVRRTNPTANPPAEGP
jgi:hypothetical protein